MIHSYQEGFPEGPKAPKEILRQCGPEGGGHWAEQPAGQAGSWTSLLKPPLDGVAPKLGKSYRMLFLSNEL